jgi:hypothetical protein
MSAPTMIQGNGVIAETGGYGVNFDVDTLYASIEKEYESLNQRQQDLRAAQKAGAQNMTLGPPPSYDANDLTKVGWGVIWPQEPLPQTFRQAVEELIEHRRQQMGGVVPHQFYYQNGWDYDHFLWEEGREVDPGTMQPEIVPYYLCIAASPQQISWEFQQYLDAEYAVGRLWFDDPQDCLKYVRALIEYEKSETLAATAREVLFVGTQNKNDPSTQNSSTRLVEPLYHWLTLAQQGQQHNFKSTLLLGSETGGGAYKTTLLTRLQKQSAAGQPQGAPALIFTASHGLEHDSPKDIQYQDQGALIMQEWPGLFSMPKPEHYLTAAEVNDQLALAGTIAFCFACFSAGTPLQEDWVRPTFWTKPKQIAPRPFVARLPQKLLAHGAVSFIGHVSRAWQSSFMGVQNNSNQIGTFTETLHGLLSGWRIGHAIDYLNNRWVHLSNRLDKWIEGGQKGKSDIVTLWLARNDCRGYAVLGDPAVRMRTDVI